MLGEHVLGLDEPVWTVALLRALDALGVVRNTARQAIARSAADGWLEREQHGRSARWRLTAPTRHQLEDGARRIYSFAPVTSGWDGRWLLVRVSAPEEHRGRRHQARSRLAWAGFGSLGQGLWISPHVDRGAALLETLRAPWPGASPAVTTTFVVEGGSVDDEQALVDEAWGDRRDLQAEYERFIAEVTAAGGDGRPLTGEAAFVAQTRMVHAWRKFPFLDPGLPRALLPGDWPGSQAAALFADRHARWGDDAGSWFRAGNHA